MKTPPLLELRMSTTRKFTIAVAPTAARLVTPSAESRRKYKNQPHLAAEQTLKFRIPASDSRFETNEALLKLLQDAKILSVEDIEATFASADFLSSMSVIPRCFPHLSSIISSLRSLAGKLDCRVLTPDQGVVAANQLYLTGCTLAASLELVGALTTYTVVDFLQEVGIDLSTYDEELGQISSSKEITDRLVALGCIDQQTIRVATRLRYLVCQRKLTCLQAFELFAFYNSNKCIGEQLIDQTVALAA